MEHICKGVSYMSGHICQDITYMSGYNVCIECGVVQKELIIGSEYIEYPADYMEVNIKKVKQIQIPRKVRLFKEINKYIKLKMTRSLSFQLAKLEDIGRSSKVIGAAFVVFKNYLDISEVVISSQVTKRLLKKICEEIEQLLD